jgi:hypothetical protein
LPRCGFPYRLATPIPRQKRHAHPHCRSGETRVERDGWIGQFSHNALITKPAALGYVRIFDWEKDIRLMIEQSNVVPDAVFCTWDTQFTNKHEWASFLGSSYFFSTDQCRASKLAWATSLLFNCECRENAARSSPKSIVTNRNCFGGRAVPQK